jgi:class 3 adenylate cyclase/tetratricopeptide (TPR) repeat protein
MEKEVAAILERLGRTGASALELLPVYQHREQQALWLRAPDLHRTFVRRFLSEGHPTRAFELAREGLASHPGDRELTYLVALALARGGNVSAAGDRLADLLKQPDLERELRAEAISLEGRLYKDRYERSSDVLPKVELAARSAACYRRAAELSGADYFPSINAATMALLADEDEEARKWARRAIHAVSHACQQRDGVADYWGLATLGEAHLLLGLSAEAASWYGQAVAEASRRGDVGSIASMRRNALLLKEKLGLSDELLRLFYVGSVVVFSGHMIDSPASVGEDSPRFPADPQLVREVSQAIKARLAELNATIGFCSAACGSDILFAEQMLDRNAELHIILPFAREDFYATSVDFNSLGMKSWRARFDALLERATEVHYVTTESYLGDDVLFDFVNNVMQGLAILRANQRGVSPQALVVIDGSAKSRLGGTRHFLDTWAQTGHALRTIDLQALRDHVLGADLRSSARTAEAAAPAVASGMERQVKAMLFADVKDFSKLREENSPRFFQRFLEEVAAVLRALRCPPIFSNTWGDGLYLVFDHVVDCAEAALHLLERVDQLDWKGLGFGATTPVRTGIHAGPVFSGIDPIIGQRNFFGSHVNRAARIEPVTIPGCAYTSEQFAALLAVEPNHHFVCEYIGIEVLAKQYDRCPLYRLARR